MSDVPRQSPPKKEVALILLEEEFSMFIHLDPRRPEVVVPKGFGKQPQLLLQVGRRMSIPIPDLVIDDEGITCTLSFNRSPFWCRIPWSAVYALVGESGRGGVWPDDVPSDIPLEPPGGAPKGQAGKKAKPRLAAVGDRSRPREEVSPAPDAVPPEIRPAARLRAVTLDEPAPGEEAAAPARPASDGAPVLFPARLGVSVDDGILEAEPVRPPAPPEPRAAEETAEQAAEETAEQAAGEDAARPSRPPGKPKREIPPYLRRIK